jgi:hypothetical protein
MGSDQVAFITIVRYVRYKINAPMKKGAESRLTGAIVLVMLDCFIASVVIAAPAESLT